MSKIAKISTLSRNNKPGIQDNLFNLDNVFYPIALEDGVVTIYSRSTKGVNAATDRFTVSGTLSDIDALFNDASSAYAENIGLFSLTVVAIDTDPYDGDMLFPVSKMSVPVYQTSQIKLRNGTTLTGTFSALTYLDKNGQNNQVFYVEETLVDLETMFNQYTNGLDRVARLYTYWRDFRTTLNQDRQFPAWLLFPVELIEAPIENTTQFAKPGEPNGLVINFLERNLNRKIPYKVASSLDNFLTNITSPGAASLFDVVNGNAPDIP